MSKGDFVMRKSGILMHITSLPGNYGVGVMSGKRGPNSSILGPISGFGR